MKSGLNYASLRVNAAIKACDLRKVMLDFDPHDPYLCPECRERDVDVSDEHQIYKCFGCGAGGNVITWIREHSGGGSTHDAINYCLEVAEGVE